MVRKLSWAVAAVVVSTATCFGQDPLADEMYGRGVHAFFSQNMQEAFQSLSTAINNGSRDPRAYYYRGLTMNRMGSVDAAKEDIRKAAELEMLGGEPYPVGRSLERIQGPERMMLEAIRRQARVELHSQRVAIDRARYEEIQRNEALNLRGGARTMPSTRSPSDVRPDTGDPFGPPPATLPAPAPLPAPVPAPASAPPAPAPSSDPFATPPAEAPLPRSLPAEAPPAPTPAPPTPAAADPFADPPTTAPAAPRPVPPAPAPAADPFAEEPTPAAPPAPAPPAPVPPAPAPAAPAPAPAADPFAEPPTPAAAPAPAPAAPAPAAPAPAPAADPFADPPTPPTPAPAPAPATP